MFERAVQFAGVQRGLHRRQLLVCLGEPLFALVAQCLRAGAELLDSVDDAGLQFFFRVGEIFYSRSCALPGPGKGVDLSAGRGTLLLRGRIDRIPGSLQVGVDIAWFTIRPFGGVFCRLVLLRRSCDDRSGWGRFILRGCLPRCGCCLLYTSPSPRD